MHLWTTDLALTTLERLVDLIICFVMSKGPYMFNFGSLSHPHGLEEAPVVHRPGPDQRIQKIPSRGRSRTCPLSSHQVLVLIGPAISESISLIQPDQSLLPQGSLRSPWEYMSKSRNRHVSHKTKLRACLPSWNEEYFHLSGV